LPQGADAPTIGLSPGDIAFPQNPGVGLLGRPFHCAHTFQRTSEKRNTVMGAPKSWREPQSSSDPGNLPLFRTAIFVEHDAA
jgi:hypothetical protein